MAIWHPLVGGLRRLLRRRGSERDLDDEVRHYVEMAAEAHRAAGLSPEEAERVARVEMGSVESVKERVRSYGWEAAVESVWRDVLYGLRMLRRSPGFTAVAVLVLALGIGINTAIFSVVNAVLFRPLPVKAPNELAYIYSANPHVGFPIYRDFLSFSLHRDVFGSTVAVSHDWARLRSGTDEEHVVGEAVSPNYFDTLGVSPSLGRAFTDDDDAMSAEPVVVISDSLWKRRFAADPTALGKTIQLDWPTITVPGRHYTIVGVMGPQFRGVSSPWAPTEYWVSLIQRGSEEDAAFAVEGFPRAPDLPGSLGVGVMIVRMTPGASFSRAAAFVSAQFSQDQRQRNMSRNSPQFVLEEARRVTLPFDPLGKLVPASLATALMIVGATVVLIAAANLAGMLMARGVARRAEIAVRLTLGAGRWRLARQLTTEGLLVSVLASAAGLLMARLLVAVFLDDLPAQFGGAFFWSTTVSLDVPVDARVLVFTAAIGVGVGLLVGLAPVRQAFKTDVVGALSGSAASPGHVRSRLRHWVVIPQVCLSLALLLVAGIAVRTLLRATTIDPGYQPAQAAFVEFSIRPLSHPRSAEERAAFLDRRESFQRRLLETAKTLPDVTAVALTMGLPVSPESGWVVSRDAFSRGGSYAWVSQAQITPDYFTALGIPLRRGRGFDDHDGPNSPKVAVVCERVAMWLWPDKDPIGQYLALHEPDSTAIPQWLEVVGVVKEVKLPLSEGGPSPWVYVPLNQQTHPYALELVARGYGTPEPMIKRLREAVVAADTNARVLNSSSMISKLNEILYPRRMAAATLGLSGAFGLFLASIGLYGVLSYSVAQRLKELGIRAALGADRRDLIALVIAEGARVAGIGSACGFVLAFVAIHLTSNRVVAIPTLDIATLVIVPLILATVVLLACYVPARRAARANPMVVLRGL
jgi:predicted permease